MRKKAFYESIKQNVINNRHFDSSHGHFGYHILRILLYNLKDNKSRIAWTRFWNCISSKWKMYHLKYTHDIKLLILIKKVFDFNLSAYYLVIKTNENWEH